MPLHLAWPLRSDLAQAAATPRPAGQRVAAKLLAGALLAASLAVSSTVRAEIFVEAGEAEASDAADDSTGPSTAFVLPLDEDLQNAIDDYSRHANRGLWEKAVEAIEAIDPQDLEGKLLAGSDGTIVSGSERLRQIQTELSAEGREAFRLFLGPKARKLFAEAMEPETPSGDRIAALQTIRRQYFPSSVGDDATNLLGDAAFRERSFGVAASLYGEVLDFHPDSEIDEAKLHYKRGLALHLAGDDRAARVALSTLRRRFAGRTVPVGGRDIDGASDLANRIGAGDGDGGNRPLASETPPLGLGAADRLEPVWQHQFLSDSWYRAVSTAARNSWRRPGAEHHVPPTAASDEVLALNYLGAVSCLDLRTGKLKWRYLNGEEYWERFKTDTDEINFDNYGIAIGDGHVYAVGVLPQSIHYYGSRPELTVLAIDAGKPGGKAVWSTNKTERGYSSDGWYVVGTPRVIDGDLYYVAGKASGYDVGEVALRRHPEGKEKGQTDISLGRYRAIGNTYNSRVSPTPEIHVIDGEPVLYLDEGMVLGLSDDDEISWGYRYDSRPVQDNSRRVYYSRSSVYLGDRLQVRGRMIVHGTRAFLKDAHTPTLHEFDLQTHRLVRTRTLPEESEIVAVDDARYYVLGEALTAYDRESGDLAWSKQIKREVGGVSAVLAGGSLHVFCDTGLFEFDASDGSLIAIRRGADESAHGGRILVAGDKLITVSPQRVTAYPLAPAAASASD